MDPLIGAILLVVLIVFSAFLSSAEIALTSMEKIRLGVLIRERPRHAKALQMLLDDPNSLLTTIAIANNFSNILASTIATLMSIEIFVNRLALFDDTASGLIATAFMTIFVLIFGEITPKTIGKNNPETLTLMFIRPMVAFRRLLTPFIFMFKAVTNLIVRFAPKHLQEQEEPEVSEDQITMLLEMGEERGLIEEEEVDMIRRIFAFDDLVAKQVMVSRTEVETIEVTATLNEVRAIVKEEEHSRYPVYDEEPDNIMGILHVKDLLHCDDNSINFKDLVRPAYFIPESKPINDLLRDFQSSKQQMAIVMDEYGGMSGLVTIEDILEEIVGEIHDEYDTPEEEIQHLPDGTFLLEGVTEIDHINDELDLTLPTEEGTTISGLILTRLEDIPETGESLTVDGTHLTVESASDREIQTVRLKILSKQAVETDVEA